MPRAPRLRIGISNALPLLIAVVLAFSATTQAFAWSFSLGTLFQSVISGSASIFSTGDSDGTVNGTTAPVCDGQIATIYVDSGFIVGGPDNGDPYAAILNGTMGDDVMVGTSGIDEINGHQGQDTICGGDDADEINGGSQRDTIFGEGGDDTIEGGTSEDMIDGGEGNDTLMGGIDASKDEIKGGPGNDDIFGGNGTDTLCGDGGDDEIMGENGADIICGGDGNDTLDGGLGPDEIDGGGDTDSINGGTSSDVCVNGETVNDCEDTSSPVATCDAKGSSSSSSISSRSSISSSSSISTSVSSSSSSTSASSSVRSSFSSSSVSSSVSSNSLSSSSSSASSQGCTEDKKNQTAEVSNDSVSDALVGVTSVSKNGAKVFQLDLSTQGHQNFVGNPLAHANLGANVGLNSGNQSGITQGDCAQNQRGKIKSKSQTLIDSTLEALSENDFDVEQIMDGKNQGTQISDIVGDVDVDVTVDQEGSSRNNSAIDQLQDPATDSRRSQDAGIDAAAGTHIKTDIEGKSRNKLKVLQKQ